MIATDDFLFSACGEMKSIILLDTTEWLYLDKDRHEFEQIC